MTRQLKIACGQMCSSSDVARNANVAIKLINQAVQKNVKVLFLPEAADYLSRDAAHSVRLANLTKEFFILKLQDHIKKLHEESKEISVAVGVHEPAEGEDFGKKVRNNQLWISNEGEVVQRYQKIHLFDIDIPNGPILKESNSVVAGLQIVPPFPPSKNLEPWKVGLAICYDIRFAEFAYTLRKLGANIITFPSAFTTTTGEAHWLTLGKARAIDSQCYVVMAAQCGEHDVYADLDEPHDTKKKVRVSYGQSVVIGPWGEIVGIGPDYKEKPDKLDKDGDYYELIEAEIDLEQVEKIRKNLPVFAHRRPDVFPTIRD